MPVFLDTTDPDFEIAFSRLLTAKREDSPDVDDTVAAIIADVRARGDAALIPPFTQDKGTRSCSASFLRARRRSLSWQRFRRWPRATGRP